MRIAFDMDGVICKGPWIEPEARTHETYLNMEPYDNGTINILKDLLLANECYIITARKYSKAAWSIQEWLSKYGIWLSHPLGIITDIRASEKYHLVGQMKCDIIVDDSPRVWQDWRTSQSRYLYGGLTKPQMLLMDNADWPENQDCKDIASGKSTYVRIYSWKELGERIASFNSRLV